MAIMVTGASGFVGRALIRLLLERNDKVVAMDTAAATFPDGVVMIAGSLSDPSVRAKALETGCSAVVHLATVPGGAAETNPQASREINVDAMYDLMLEAAAAGSRPRFVYASSVAVYGDPLPERVDDNTPLSPKLFYAGHKAMMEPALAMFSNRGMLDGVTVRLPGIIARPKGPSGMKSAFMSDLFHALKARQEFTCPVSAAGAVWVQSVNRCAHNFAHALTMDSALLPSNRAVTLPALHVTMGALADEVARQCGVPASLVQYRPDKDLEAAFAAQPPIATPAAESAGFCHDGDIAALVSSALSTL